jgi:hypothetical protein
MTRVRTKEREPDLLGAAPTTAAPAKPPAKVKAVAQPKNEVAKIEPLRPPASVLEIIARIAADPNIDTDKMRAVIEIQRDTESKQQFHDAMVAMDDKLPRINKDGKIEIRGSTKAILFASFENLNRQIKPILRDFGFRLNFQPDTAANGQGIVVHCHLTRGLYRESCTVPVSTSPASPAMNAQQSVGAAISYAKRYGAIALLNIETEAPQDRDNDAATDKKKLRPSAGAAAAPEATDQPEPNAKITGVQAKELLKVIDECGVEATLFMEKYKVMAVHELPAAMFAEAIKSCRDYAARVKSAADTKASRRG